MSLFFFIGCESMLSVILLIGIWFLLKIGVESLDEMIEAAQEYQIRESLVAKLFVLQKGFEISERFVWFVITLPIRAVAIIVDLFDAQTG